MLYSIRKIQILWFDIGRKLINMTISEKIWENCAKYYDKCHLWLATLQSPTVLNHHINLENVIPNISHIWRARKLAAQGIHASIKITRQLQKIFELIASNIVINATSVGDTPALNHQINLEFVILNISQRHPFLKA